MSEIKAEKCLPFTHYAQQNVETDALMSIADNTLAMKIYLVIIRKMNAKNALVASYRFFMDCFKASKTTVWRAVRKLEDEKILQVKRCGGTTVFLLNPNTAWKGNGYQVKHCGRGYREVDGTVVFTESEWGEDNDKE